MIILIIILTYLLIVSLLTELILIVMLDFSNLETPN